MSPRAAAEIERAETWWLKNRLAAPQALRDDLAAAFHLLLQQPGIGVKLSSARVVGARRLYLERVRYFVYYGIEDGELRILAFWHASRRRGPSV